MIIINKENYNKFRKSGLPCNYSIDEIDFILKQKYSVNEIDITTFTESDPYYDVKNVVKIYKIEDKSILDKLYNEEEKKFHKDTSEQNDKKYLRKSEVTNLSVLKWRDAEEGNLIMILLEKRGQNDLFDFTIQGQCDKLILELTILRGMDPKDCIPGNHEFDNYLNCLTKLGYI